MTGPRHDPSLHRAVTGLAAALAAGVATLWATGQVAGRVNGGAWPDTPASAALGIALRLSADPSDPSSAWPQPAAALLPGPVTFYTTLALLVVLATLAAVAAIGGWQQARKAWQRRRGCQATDASWARRRELRDLHVSGPTGDRIILGRAGRQLIAAAPLRPVLVFGPQRSRKTTGIAIPNLLEWDGPAVVTSVRADIVDATIAQRGRRGRAWVYEPTGRAACGHPTIGWDPLAECATWEGALLMGDWLGAAGDAGGIDNASFWTAQGSALLAPILFAAATAGHGMSQVSTWVRNQDHDQVTHALQVAGEASALATFEGVWEMDARTRSNVYATAGVQLRAFRLPSVLASCDAGGIDVGEFFDGGAHTLYLCAPADEQRTLQPLFVALLQRILREAYSLEAAGRRPAKALMVLLDEAGNVAPLPDLAGVATTAAGTGIQLVSIFHDFAQLQAVYGRERGATVAANHSALLVLPGGREDTTLNLVSRLVGETEVERESQSTSPDGHTSRQRSTQHRALATADQLRRLQPGTALLLYEHLQPTRLTLRSSTHDPQLRGPRQATSSLSNSKPTPEGGDGLILSHHPAEVLDARAAQPLASPQDNHQADP